MPPEGGGKFPRLSLISELGVTLKIPHNQVEKAVNHFAIARMAISSLAFGI